MVLTFAEDFSSNILLDNELTGTPSSGLFWNRGVLPILTVKNMLDFLPRFDYSFSAWSSLVTYSKFETSRKMSDIVTYQSKIYQSLKDTNLNKVPGVDTTYWLETNIESLRIKSFIFAVTDNLISQLSLSRKLIENQYLYDTGTDVVALPNDYAGWVFEPKGSDYVKIRINQISLRATNTTPCNMYVINNGAVIKTIQLTPVNGALVFEDIDYVITGKGRFVFAIDSQSVQTNQGYNDPLKYTGFVCYPVTGTGTTPQSATYEFTNYGNGMNFNVSAYLDSSQFVTNNLIDLARILQLQMEMDFLQMVQLNPNSRVHGDGRDLMSDKNLLTYYATDMTGNTVARRYAAELKQVKDSINRTFDNFLKSPKRITIRRDTI